MPEGRVARLALDEDVRPLLARLLRERGWDAVSVQDEGRGGCADEDQLEWALREQRVLVTHNAGDFAQLGAEWTRAGRAHAGILILRQANVGTHLSSVLRALGVRGRAQDWTDQVVWGAAAPTR